MCVDDIVCHGAEPLFFLDYIAVGRLVVDHVDQLVEGMAEACRQAGCALIGGEMAEHPGAMEPGEFDLVGFTVGVVERDQMITGERIRPGDVLVGLPSPGCGPTATRSPAGCCSSGRGAPSTAPRTTGAHHSLADELLVPSVVYAPAVRRRGEGGVDCTAWPTSPAGGSAATWPGCCPVASRPSSIARHGRCPGSSPRSSDAGDVDGDEMEAVFNLGIGMVVVVPAADAFRTIDVLRTNGHAAREIGVVESGYGDVRLIGHAP